MTVLPRDHVRGPARWDPTRALRGGWRVVARFGTIGLLAYVVDLGVFNLARHGLDLGPLSSKTLSVLVATVVAFLGNSSWAFGGRARSSRVRAWVLFAATNAAGLLIGVGCLAVSSYLLGLTSPLAENVSSNLVGVGLGTLFRFWAYQRWVFPERA